MLLTLGRFPATRCRGARRSSTPHLLSVWAAGTRTAGLSPISGAGPWTSTVSQTCAAGDWFTIAYGAGTSTTKVTARTAPGAETFTAGSRSGSSGTAQELAPGNSPTVT